MKLIDELPGISLLTSVEDIPRDQWEEFVHHHPDGTIFQTPIMFDAFRSVSNHEPFVLAAAIDKRMVGVLNGVILSEYSGLASMFTSRAIIWGGPIVERNDNGIAAQLMHAYSEWIGSKAIYSQFRNLHDQSWARRIFETQGFIYEDHLNILIDLRRSEDDLWKAIHGKRRNEIRRAYREGTTFSVYNEEDKLHQGYQILKEVYQHAKLPFPKITLFQNMLKCSSSSSGLRIFTACHQGKMIGVMFALLYKKRIYDWYAGALRQYLHKYPNDLIPWEVIKWGRGNGFECFDFGGAGKPTIPYGVRDYKLKYGGEVVNFGRWQSVHKKIKMCMARFGFKIWQAIK